MSTDKVSTFLLIIIFPFLFILFLHPVGGDGDYYHHLTAGKDILLHHRLQQVDSFTFTASGKEWINHSWLSGVLFYLIDSAGGPRAVSLFVAGIGVLTCLIFLVWLKSYRLSPAVIFWLLVLVAAGVSTRWPSRPEIFTPPLAFSLLLIDRLRASRRWLLFFFPLITLAWANLYGGGSLLGDMLIVLLVIKQYLTNKGKIEKKDWIFYAPSSLALVCSLFNGYGFKSLFYIYFIKDIGQTQLEWFGPIRIVQSAPYGYLLTFQYSFLIYIFFVSLLITALFFNGKKTKMIPFEAFLGIAALVPLFAFRHLAIAILLSSPLCGLLLEQSSPRYKSIGTTVLGVLAALSIVAAWWSNPPSFQLPDQYPTSLITFMKHYAINGRSLHDPQDGGFLSYHFYPDIKIYADTRDELYRGTSILEDYYQAVAEASVPQLIEKEKIDVVIGDLSQGEAFKALFYSSQWAPVYIGGKYFVAIPTNVAQAKGIPTLDAVDPFSFSQAKKGREQEALELYRQFATDHADSVDDQMRYARILFFLKKYDESLRVLADIHTSEAPRNVLFIMGKEYLTAMNYLNKGDCLQTKDHLDAIDQGLKSFMIFTPKKHVTSPAENGYRLYNSHCQ